MLNKLLSGTFKARKPVSPLTHVTDSSANAAQSAIEGTGGASSTANWAGTISTGADAMRKRRDIYGQTLRFPGGETISTDNCGAVIVKNGRGDVVRTYDQHGKQTEFGYDCDHKLWKITFSDGKVCIRDYAGRWCQFVDGKKIRSERNTISVTSDGTIKTKMELRAGQATYRLNRLDGSIAVVSGKGRLLHLRTSLDTQQTRLEEVLRNLFFAGKVTEPRLTNFRSLMTAFIRRNAMGQLSTSEIAQTFYHLARMLEAGSAELSDKSRIRMAHELIFCCAFPDLIKAPDGLTSLARELFLLQPSEAVNVVASACLKGEYITANDRLIPIDALALDPRNNVDEWVSFGLKDRTSLVWTIKLLRSVIVQLVDRTRDHEKERALAAKQRDFAPTLSLTSDRLRKVKSTAEFGSIKLDELHCAYKHITGNEKANIVLFVDPQIKDMYLPDPERSITKAIPRIALALR